MSPFGENSGVHRRPTNGVEPIAMPEVPATVTLPRWMTVLVALGAVAVGAGELWHLAQPSVLKFTGFAAQADVDDVKARTGALEKAVAAIGARFDDLPDRIAEKVNHRRK